MKKEYSKPNLNTKAFAQFENVFTACSKGHEGKVWKGNICQSGVFPDPSSDPSGSAAFKANGSI